VPKQAQINQAPMKALRDPLDHSRSGSGLRDGEDAPCVIVSLDVLNRQLNTVTVCPADQPAHPTWRSRLQVRCRGRAAEVAVDQIRTVSKSRLGAKIGSLSKDEAADCVV
jgi:mRNA-degrading endonuclease toxin of MazEF toxin-antitoxin module